MYPFSSVCKQGGEMYTFHQNYLTNNQWYEKFNTNSDVSNSVGVAINHKIILYYVARKNCSDVFENITDEQKKTVRADA